jgi:hypothetical protein
MSPLHLWDSVLESGLQMDFGFVPGLDLGLDYESGFGLAYGFDFEWGPGSDLESDFLSGLGLILDFGKVDDQTVFGLLLGNLNLVEKHDVKFFWASSQTNQHSKQLILYLL